MRRRRKVCYGFTLIEIIAVIAVVAIMVSLITPLIAKHLEDAKISRTAGDVKMIGAALGDFYKDNGRWPFYIDPSLPLSETNVLWLLIGAGRDAAFEGGEGAETRFWNEAGSWPANRIDRLEDHLVYNAPPMNHYNAERWNGPYLANIAPDPWGSHYSVNVAYLSPFYSEGEAVWILSPGKNATWETDISQVNDASLTIGGDDIGFRIK